MKRAFATLALFLAGAAGAAETAGKTPWRVQMDAFGPVTSGMTSAQIQQLVGGRFLEDDDTPTEECWYLRALDDLNGVSFMIIDNKLARIEIDSPKVLTLSGAGIDTTEEQLKKLYGRRLKIEADKNREDQGHYLTLQSKDGQFGIRFDIENGRVFRFYAGPWEHLRYVRGCADMLPNYPLNPTPFRRG